MRGRTLQLVASLGLLTLVAAWQVWDYWEARRLHAAILQIQARGEPVNAFEAMRQDAPKGAEGSGRFYAAADALLLIPDGTTQRLELLRRNLEASGRASAEERNHLGEFLRLNGPALELIARARELPFQGLPRDPGYDPRSSPRGPHVVVPRLASVLSAQALQLTLHGDGDGAARAVSAILRLLAGLSVEQSMFALGLHQRVLSRAVQDLVLILERTRPRDSPLAELQAALRSTDRAGDLVLHFLGERARYIEVTAQVFGQHAGLWPIQGPPAGRGLQHVLMRPWLRSLARDDIDVLSAAVAASRQPLPEALTRFDGLQPESSASTAGARWPAWRSLAAPELQPLYAQAHAYSLARARGAAVAVAIERYRRDHEKLPDSLEALMPSYLDTVAEDPFTGAPLRYVQDATGYAVYSVGPNRSDDGGLFTPPPAHRGIAIEWPEESADWGIRVRMSGSPG